MSWTGWIFWKLYFCSWKYAEIIERLSITSAYFQLQKYSFIFFLWNQLRVSLALCLRSLSCWNVHPRFIFIILVDGSRFLTRMSLYIFSFIHPSMIWSLPVPYAEKQPRTMMFPPPNFTVGMVFFGDVQCHLTSQHGVFYGIQRIQFWTHLTRLYSPSISQAFLNVVHQTLNKLQHYFSSSMESCVVSMHTGRRSFTFLTIQWSQTRQRVSAVAKAKYTFF